VPARGGHPVVVVAVAAVHAIAPLREAMHSRGTELMIRSLRSLIGPHSTSYAELCM
jgi:hypothetical protein